MFRHQISLHRHQCDWDCVDIFDLQWWRIDWNWTKNLNWIPGAVRAPDGDAWKRSWGWRRCRSVDHVQRGKPTWLLIHVCWLIRQIRFPLRSMVSIFCLFSRFATQRTQVIGTCGTGTSTETTWTDLSTWYTRSTTSKNTTNRTWKKLKPRVVNSLARTYSKAFNQYHCWNFCHVDVKYY